VVCVLDHNLSHRCHVQAWHAIQAMSAKTHGTEWSPLTLTEPPLSPLILLIGIFYASLPNIRAQPRG